MTTTFEKKALLTGIGNGFFQIMTTEETPTTAPVYDSRVFEVPSLDKLKTKLEYKSKDIYLSSALHSVLGKASKATITLDAGYLPDGFEEEVSGATKLADGVYGMGGKGTKKYFRFAFPMIDENGEKIIINFPKCQIQPTDLNVESQAEDKKEQMQQFDIIAMPLATGKEEESNIYYKADLRKNKTLDERKLLEKGFYNKAGLTELNKNTDTSSTTSASTTISTNRVS
ncbi:TPA: phage tail protein [Staphylococcus aureus]|nr:phage tail protein [Staphylococcus aureus]